MSRKDLIAFGGVAAIIAIMAAVYWKPAIGAPLGLGALLFAAVVFRIRGIVRRARAERFQGPDPDPDQMVGRFGPSEDAPQLAGSRCAYCGQRIVTALEAATCRVCQMPVHHRCSKDHRLDKHRPESGVPYR